MKGFVEEVVVDKMEYGGKAEITIMIREIIDRK